MIVYLAMSGLVPVDGNSKGAVAAGATLFLISFGYLAEAGRDSMLPISHGMCQPHQIKEKQDDRLLLLGDGTPRQGSGGRGPGWRR